MSWDVILLKSKIDLGDTDTKSEPLGEKRIIINNLTSLLPNLDFSDPSWGIFADGMYSIEFNMGDEEIVESIMLHIRGGGNPLVIIKTICDSSGWVALDCSNAEFIDTDNLSKMSWEEFQKYRDKIRLRR